jgi:2-isopropylmalate synthase
MAKKRTITIYDTTLRDGAQTKGITFSPEDKLRITAELDSMGVPYIEAGWPSANPKDLKFYEDIKTLKLKQARIVAFGSTHRPGLTPARDPAFKSLLRVEPAAACIVGKASSLHVRDVLRISFDDNLRLISNTIHYLKNKGLEVFFDAEHFFDGFFLNPEYALQSLGAAADAGADALVLCDTNGGTLPWDIEDVVRRVRERLDTPIGIHVHNDAGAAMAGSLAAVRAGATQVQGTINGYGERCGNADLCAIIANLSLKMNCETIPRRNLARLAPFARFVSELANRPLPPNRPFTGASAFTHKAGFHADAVRKNPATYEHVPPESVGNVRDMLVSDQSGKANVMTMCERLGVKLGAADVKKVLARLKDAEFGGYQYDGAEGSFEILVHKTLGTFKPFFELEGLRIVVTKRRRTGESFSEASIAVRMGDKREFTAAEGDGPVNALDNALRKALEPMFPCLEDVRLTDYKVRVLDEREGTAAGVRVLITSRDKTSSWSTVGVSENVIEASWIALVDSIELKLLRETSK